MNRLLTIAVLAVMILFGAGVLAAQAPVAQAPVAQATAAPEAAEPAVENAGTLRIILSSGFMLNWPEPSQRLAVADESIVRLMIVSKQEVVIDGLKPGRTTLFVWLESGRRLLYELIVQHNLEPAQSALREFHANLILESGADRNSVVLRGEVANETEARQVRSIVEQLLPRTGGDGSEQLRLVNLVRYAGSVGTPEDRLGAAMAEIDPRIFVRRIQSGVDPDPALDSYILEGRVHDVNDLVRAVIIADRQLGGTGKTVRAADDERVTFDRSQSNGSNLGITGGGAGGGAGGGNALQALRPGSPSRSGISAQLARGLVLTSESGQVVSFLEVDSLPQVLVSIRVLEIDRVKARRLGMNVRFDSTNVSIGSTMIPGSNLLSGGSLPNVGNLVGAFINNTVAVTAAFDLLAQKQVARSVAEPNILTLSGEEASVLVGGQVPIPTTVLNQISVQSGFYFQQFGVRLDIRPTVDKNNIVTLEVAPSIVTPSSGLGNGSVPGFQIQRVETTGRVPAGQSLLLGGLLTSTESIENRRLPGLGFIPIFRWQSRRTEDLELIFLITPRIIEPPTGEVRLPALESDEFSIRDGQSGLGADGVPLSFKPRQGKVLGTDGSCLEIRERPDHDAPVVDCLLPKMVVHMTEQKGLWRYVETSDGRKGWVLAEMLAPAN